MRRRGGRQPRRLFRWVLTSGCVRGRRCRPGALSRTDDSLRRAARLRDTCSADTFPRGWGAFLSIVLFGRGRGRRDSTYVRLGWVWR